MIEHKHGATNLLTLDYNYTPDGLIDRIDQSDTSGLCVMNYVYDRRGRLIDKHGSLPPVPTGEGGSGVTTAVDLAYAYDQVGNRLSKTDAGVSPTKVRTYFYDVHDDDWQLPGHAMTQNNRLLKTETIQNAQVIERVIYLYTLGGHVKRITRQSNPDELDPGDIDLTCLEYDSDQHVWLARGYTVQDDGEGTTCTTATFAREFRYDGGGRRRYWVRERDPGTLAEVDDSQGWREYLGDSIYAELVVNPATGETDTARRYLHAGDGRLIGWREGASWQFVHADHLGSTRLVTTPTAGVGSRLGYSAFGELISEANPGGLSARSRYGYCGGWGYENDGLSDPAKELGMLHVGARYYTTALGRFLQRDPIGVWGGIGVYVYALASPVGILDPTGFENAVSITSTAGIGSGLGAIMNSGVRAGVEIAVSLGLTVPAYFMIRTPAMGPPNSSAAWDYGDGGTIRIYGPDGKAVKDIDFGHDHADCGDPHVHDWNWGGNNPRGPATPPTGNESWP